MREQLIQYVDLLFAGAPDSEDMRAEILQNTLDRYDDLIGQGKAPAAAYRLAISGIGDINEILGDSACMKQKPTQDHMNKPNPDDEDTPEKRKMRSIAIAMYILCPIPLFILADLGVSTLGLCLTIALVATATYIMINYGKNDPDKFSESAPKHSRMADRNSPESNLKKSISYYIWVIGLAAYLILSFATDAWYITWLLFPIIGCTDGLAKAILDLKEANKHES